MDEQDRVGQIFGHYQITRELGRGGMSVVYEAIHTEGRQRVALKLLPPSWAGHSSYRERFYREALAASKVSHPGLVQVFDFGGNAVFHAVGPSGGGNGSAEGSAAIAIGNRNVSNSGAGSSGTIASSRTDSSASSGANRDYCVAGGGASDSVGNISGRRRSGESRGGDGRAVANGEASAFIANSEVSAFSIASPIPKGRGVSTSGRCGRRGSTSGGSAGASGASTSHASSLGIRSDISGGSSDDSRAWGVRGGGAPTAQ